MSTTIVTIPDIQLQLTVNRLWPTFQMMPFWLKYVLCANNVAKPPCMADYDIQLWGVQSLLNALESD